MKKLFSIILSGFMVVALASAPIGCQGAAKEKEKDKAAATDKDKTPAADKDAAKDKDKK